MMIQDIQSIGETMMKSNRNRILMLGIAAELMASAAAAQAPAAAAGEVQLDNVVVTASRVSREGFNAPTPTTVISELQLEARGFTNITDAINETPVFRASNGPATAQRGGGSSGGSSLDLRGLNGGVARTLVLIDGRRHVPSTVSGLVDLNMIPTGLVERTEVVTGGASAAWGSDAVAGVVNILLKDDLQGIQSHVAYAQTGHSDYIESTVNLAGGTAFAGGRGHVIAGFDYVKNDGIADGFRSRDWMKRSWTGTLFNYGGAPRPAGVPQRVFSEDFRNGDTASSGGVIVGGPLDNITFLGGQNTGIFTTGSLVAGTNMIGGGANNSNADLRVIDGSNLVNPIERNSALVRVKYDLTDSLEAFVEGSRAVSSYEGFSASRRDQGTIVVRQDNAFLPTAIRNQMVNLNLATINVGRIALDDNYNYYSTLTGQQTERVAAGLKGELGGSWRWDAYYQFGQNHFKQRNQSTINSNFTAATDAVLVNGQIVCRNMTGVGADPGCVPFNIFGRNAPSQAAVDYVRGVGINDVTYKQQAGAVNINGDLFTLPAGAVAVAAGAEYRKEEVASKVDARSAGKALRPQQLPADRGLVRYQGAVRRSRRPDPAGQDLVPEPRPQWRRSLHRLFDLGRRHDVEGRRQLGADPVLAVPRYPVARHPGGEPAGTLLRGGPGTGLRQRRSAKHQQYRQPQPGAGRGRYLHCRHRVPADVRAAAQPLG